MAEKREEMAAKEVRGEKHTSKDFLPRMSKLSPSKSVSYYHELHPSMLGSALIISIVASFSLVKYIFMRSLSSFEIGWFWI